MTIYGVAGEPSSFVNRIRTVEAMRADVDTTRLTLSASMNGGNTVTSHCGRSDSRQSTTSKGPSRSASVTALTILIAPGPRLSQGDMGNVQVSQGETARWVMAH